MAIKRSIDERNQLIAKNTGLVYSCANKFKGKGVEFDDLIQSGFIGLIKAAEGFDDSLGYMFSTYAVPAILGEIKRIFRDGGAVKIGRTDKEKARKIMLLRDELIKLLDREPTVNEISDRISLSPEEVSGLLCASLPVISLTADDESGSRELSVTAGDMTEDITERLSLVAAIESLPERDKKIIKLRYFSGLTQAATAEILGMTQVQVSRREKRILSQIKQKVS